MNLKLEEFGWILKPIQVQVAHGNLETQLQIVNLFKNLLKLWKAMEDQSEFMQVLTCGTRFLVANKFVQTLNHILYGMPDMTERSLLMIFTQTNLVAGTNLQ